MENNLRKPDVVTVAITRVDGGLTMLRVVVNDYGPNPENPTERILYRHNEVTPEYVNSLIKKYVDGGSWSGELLPVSWRFVPNDFVDENTDRTFRDAWKDNSNGKPEVDMPKAKEIHRGRLRKKRGSLLDALDAEYMKANEKGDKKKVDDVVRRKQELRDITQHPDIEKANTPEELKTVALHILNNS